MSTIYDKFHANKSERLRSFEATVNNIFDKKLRKFDNIFETPKRPDKITHVQIFDCDGGYYFRKIHGSLAVFDHEDHRSKRYILYRSVSMKKTIATRKNVYCVKIMKLTMILPA